MTSASCRNSTVIPVGEAEKLAYGYLHTCFISVIMPLILGIGIVSNSAFLFVVFRVTFMHNITGCYLANLSLADMTFLLSAVVPKIINYMGSPIYPDSTTVGIGGCIAGYVSSNTAYFASLLFISYVSWERFRAVCRPHKKPAKWKHVVVLVTVTWILCFGFSLTFVPAFAKFEQKCLIWPKNGTYSDWPNIQSFCQSISPQADSYAGGAQTTPFFICFVTNMILHICIIKGLKRSSSRLHRHSQESGSQKKRNEKERASIQVTRMLLINSFLFFILLSPFEFLSLSRSLRFATTAKYYGLSADNATIVTFVFQALSYTNSIINPIVYTAFSKRFRKAFILAFTGNSAEVKSQETTRHGDKSPIRLQPK